MKERAMKRFVMIFLGLMVAGAGVAEAARGGGGGGGSWSGGGGGMHGGGGSWQGGSGNWHGGSGNWHGGSGNWHGGHSHGSHSNFVVGVGFGWPYWGWGWGWPYYYPTYYPYSSGYYYPYYPYDGDYPSGYGNDYSAPRYIQRGDDQSGGQGSDYSYYCPDPAGYYPQVATCARGWLRVAPSNAPGPVAPPQR